MSMSYRPPSPTGEETGRPPVTSSEPLSLIDRYSSIEGTFTTSRDVRVEGVVRGRLDCQGLLYIAEGADIDATVEAASITVAGKLNGEVTCRGRLQITSTGRMVATVTTDSLVIDEGAFYEGDLNMKSSRVASGARAAGVSGDVSPSVLRRFSGEDDEEEGESQPRRGSASS
jgi:cytoskeletal protein CcmA (bactofilin family)